MKMVLMDFSFYEINEALEYFLNELTAANLQDEVIHFIASDLEEFTSNGPGR